MRLCCQLYILLLLLLSLFLETRLVSPSPEDGSAFQRKKIQGSCLLKNEENLSREEPFSPRNRLLRLFLFSLLSLSPLSVSTSLSFSSTLSLPGSPLLSLFPLLCRLSSAFFVLSSSLVCRFSLSFSSSLFLLPASVLTTKRHS